MKKLSLILLLGLVVISFTSALTPLQQEVKNYWLNEGLNESESQLIAEGKSNYVEPKENLEPSQEPINETLILEEEAEFIQQERNLLAGVFIFIFIIILLGSLITLIYLWVSGGRV